MSSLTQLLLIVLTPVIFINLNMLWSIKLLFTNTNGLTKLANSEDLLDFNNSSSIFIVLWAMILLSLFSTFYFQSSPVHKVLALLSLSLCVVILWIYETDFLFIYLVYILAFVGAVLMLFLSVVLMLPISTIHKSSFFSPVLMVASISNVPLTAVSLRPGGLESQSVPFSLPPVESLFSPGYALFVLVLLITYSMVISQLVTWLGNRFSKPLTWRSLTLWYQTWCTDFYEFLHDDLAGSCSIRTRDGKFPTWRVMGFVSDNDSFWFRNRFVRYFGSRGLKLPFTFSTAISATFTEILAFFKLPVRQSYVVWTNMFILVCAFFYSIFIIQPLYFCKSVFLCLHAWRPTLKRGYQHLFYSFVQRNYFEYGLQIFLFFGFALTMIPVWFPTAVAVVNTYDQAVEVEGGLANIKILLYEQTGLFLLTSTLVLLVALIGAAVMTRNKR